MKKSAWRFARVLALVLKNTKTSSLSEKGLCSITGYKQCLLPHIEIPCELYGNSVTEISPKAFMKCDFLEEVFFAPYNEEYPDGGAAVVGDNAFSYCNRLKKVIFAPYVQKIGESAFCRCENLFALEFGDGLRYIGDRAFSGCLSLREVIIPPLTEYIGYSAFAGCKHLVSVEIPESVTYLTRSSFENCPELSEIYVKKDSYADIFLSKSALYYSKLKRK